ncbi:MAG: hypothetical protein IIA64_10760 [Planctomycetes bacterium]|nr:hypothetical protein [Planctomycetota bacterium]
MSYKQSHLSRRSRRPWTGRASLIALGWCLSWAVVSSAAAQETCYRIVDLGELGFTPGIDDISGINNANQAVFTAVVGGKKHAMLYLPAAAYDLAAGVHDLHDLAGAAIPGDESAVHDLNDAGIAVGWGEIGGERHAFVWRLDADPFEFIDLGTFANGDWSEAWAINNDSPFPIIVGDGENKDDCSCDSGNDDIVRAFWLPLTDPANDLPTAVQLFQAPERIVGCDQNTKARDVNTNGVQRTAAGYSVFGTPFCHAPLNCGSTENATVWVNPDPMNSTGIALPFLSGDDALTSVASGISDVGATVGSGYTAPNAPCLQHALYWDTVIVPPVDLGEATGIDPSFQSLAVRINNNQSPQTLLAVGWMLASPNRPLLWACAGGCDLLGSWAAVELNGPVLGQCGFSPDEWLILELFDVNDNGWVIGVGRFAGENHAVLLTPLANCPPGQCKGDLDGDGSVGVKDLLILLGAWGPCPAPPAPCDADLDCDGTVGVLDLLILLGNWGPCGAPIATTPPQNIQDCMDRFSAESEDELALIKCLETVSQ